MHQTLKQRYDGSYIKTPASVGRGRGQEKAGTCGHRGRRGQARVDANIWFKI